MKYSDTATKQNTMSSAIDKMLPEQFGGRVRCARFTYTGVAADDVSGTVLNLVKLPAGARVLPQSKIWFEAGQNAALTVQVGDADDDDRYLAATVPGASATSLELSGAVFSPSKLSAAGYISLTTGGDQALADGKMIAGEILYVLD